VRRSPQQSHQKSNSQDGDILVETVLVSVDPYLFAMTKQQPNMHESKPVQQSSNISRVVESRAAGFEKGDFVQTRVGGWVDKAVLAAASVQKLAYKVGDSIGLPEYLNALGMIGRTALHGISTVFGQVKNNEVALVTGAAGAVGELVVQLLKVSTGVIALYSLTCALGAWMLRCRRCRQQREGRHRQERARRRRRVQLQDRQDHSADARCCRSGWQNRCVL
jgi:NADPH-dependent curcumin reductase CurA